MSVVLFVFLAAICCLVSSLLTEAIKAGFKNANKKYSANMIALINGLLVGCGGSAAAYVFLGIAFTLPNILCLILMGFVVWMGSMIGYDKVMQLVEQIAAMKM